MSDINVFDGFLKWVEMTNFLIENKITSYEVRQDIKDVKIEGHVIIIPPDLERIIIELLKEIPQDEQPDY